MPMTRYEIRNEYSLADPDLYRAADKDDPEALLEGVAMAGLVGVLRQLGDLAEFAAEIFHNLHEEVMATAARGHGLMVRVQQLETEIPSIERAFLSQTDHSSFFYHAGLDWHPNLRQDQNLVTQGDLPRFIMDSYEDCRAPPRLFLLDKFDVAGAGSCLKRYTDPSFFKVEASEITNTDVQREKKIRKAKKKGPRWRNGETPEVLPTSHTSKLHQLFLEERVENGVRNPSSRVKLKRRLNGFPFDSKTGKSYMETLLKSPSPDHKVLHEVTVNSSPVMSTTNKESGFKIYEVQPLSPDRVSGGRNRSPPSSVDDEQSTVNPSMYEPNKSPINDEPCEAPNSYPSIAANGISSTLEKVVAMDAESYREGSLNGYQSDDIASEIDNYVDAPSTMESEMDGDSELRVKSDITSPHLKSGSLISDADEEHLHTRSSDSQSTGDSIIFDEGNNSFIKEMSSFSSDSPTTSAEKPEAENNSVKGFQYDDVPVNEMVNTSSYQKTADEEFQVNDQSKPVGSDDTCTVTNAITNCSSEFEQLTASLCNYRSIPASMHSASEEVRKCMLKAPESDEIISTLNDNEKKADLAIDPPCSPSHCGSVLQSEDDSPGSSAGEHLVDEPSGKSLPWRTTVPDNNCHTADSLVKTSLDSLHECESDEKDRNMVGKITSTSNVLNDLSMNDTSDTISSKNQVPGKLEDEFPFPENSPDLPVTAHNGDNIESAVFEEDNLIDVLGDESANGSTDSPNHFPCITEASLEKQLHETSYADSQTANVEENCSSSSTDNQINSENLKSWNLVDSPDKPVEGLDAHAVDVIPEEETTINEILALETLKPCEGGGLQGIGLTHHDFHNDSEALESSPCILEDLEKTAGTEDTAEMDGVSLCSSNTGREVTEVSGTADLNSVNAVHILLDTSDSEIDKSNTTALPAVSDNVSLNKLVKEHNNCFENSCFDELENEEKCPSECDGKSDIVEDVGSTDASAPGFESDFCNAVNNDHPESKVSGIVPKSNLVLEVDRDLNLVHAAMIESPVEQYGIDREQELYDQSDHGNPVPDALSLSVDYDAGEAMAQEKIESPLDQLDQKLPNPDEISSEFSPLLPTHHQQILNNDDCMQDKDSSPVLSLVECQGSPPFSELSRQSNHEIDVPEYSKDPLGFIFPPSNPFSEKNQINLSDLPPLPPLPPVEWRMGKLLNFSSSTEGELMKHNDLSPQLISPLAVPSGAVNSSMPPTSTDDTGSSPPTSSTIDIYSIEETKHSLIETTPETASKEENGETASKEENSENSCSSLEANSLHETADLPPKLKDERHQIIMPISEGASTSPPEENGVENGSQTVKLPRPRNPLVGDVAVLDKSKLRKVTERVWPEIQKVDERDSLLEQIRTKSFNLKPAMPTRPSIRGGPSTNLNVAAMLEKANAIRQAFAGSDEDDSDSWSDS